MNSDYGGVILKQVNSLKTLRKIYLCVHALSWIDISPKDEAQREMQWGGGEHWPGRTEKCHKLDLKLRDKLELLINSIQDDEAFFFLPTGLKGNTELIEYAKKKLGPRCVVCRVEHDINYNREFLGTEFVEEIERDTKKAIENSEREIPKFDLENWEKSKAWALDLNKQLNMQGYTYDPSNVEFIACGENWVGCGAVYPIQMGRAFGLSNPIERRFDLINPDWSPVLLEAIPIDQNLPMPEQIRLFIFKIANAGPIGWTPSPPIKNRYVAQYWEGIRGIMDPAHQVEVNFPIKSVREINLFGVDIARTRGLWAEPNNEPMLMTVGAGFTTPYHSSLVMAEENTNLNEFRSALLSGKVTTI